MSRKQTKPLNERILAEIWDSMDALEGSALDEYLSGIGLVSEELLQHYQKSVKAAILMLRRSRFEEAQLHLRNRSLPITSNVVSFDIVRKRQILASINKRMAQTKDMTMAARNHNESAEEDLDSFLEACFRLGVIDEDGNLKV